MTDEKDQAPATGGDQPAAAQPSAAKEAQVRVDLVEGQNRAEWVDEFAQRANIGDRRPLHGIVTAEPVTGVAPSATPATPATPATTPATPTASPASTPADQSGDGSSEGGS
jgi:hypothetical protein